MKDPIEKSAVHALPANASIQGRCSDRRLPKNGHVIFRSQKETPFIGLVVPSILPLIALFSRLEWKNRRIHLQTVSTEACIIPIVIVTTLVMRNAILIARKMLNMRVMASISPGDVSAPQPLFVVTTMYPAEGRWGLRGRSTGSHRSCCRPDRSASIDELIPGRSRSRRVVPPCRVDDARVPATRPCRSECCQEEPVEHAYLTPTAS